MNGPQRQAGATDGIEGRHERCCESVDPTCVNWATCAERAWREVERLRILYGRDRQPTPEPPADGTNGEIDRLRRWQYDACTAIRSATVIGQRHGVGLNYANHDRLLDEASEEVRAVTLPAMASEEMFAARRATHTMQSGTLVPAWSQHEHDVWIASIADAPVEMFFDREAAEAWWGRPLEYLGEGRYE